MSKKIVIKVEHATVRYNLSKERILSLKDYLIQLVKGQLMFQEFFALSDVSFTVREGDSWGIVGRNGSGKSTLLKLISGVLKPYNGSVRVYGAIAPLLELGAGFDDRLTARENIYLNGLMLGQTKKFLTAHFDEIVAFSELEKFLDVPVKNFSSGMRSRLGFSIATATRPQILIVDEVLAAGDRLFREKCERRMQEMLSCGTTLLFVSHSSETVKNLCKNALWLREGRVVMSGSAEDVCGAYEQTKE